MGEEDRILPEGSSDMSPGQGRKFWWVPEWALRLGFFRGSQLFLRGAPGSSLLPMQRPPPLALAQLAASVREATTVAATAVNWPPIHQHRRLTVSSLREHRSCFQDFRVRAGTKTPDF